MERIYLDHAATTPLSRAAREAMAEWSDCGNPSSLYEEGRRAKDAIDASREVLSAAVGCRFAELLFTSGGTESVNLAIVGTALANEDARRRVILFGAAEHHCVLHTRPLLERLGYRVELLPVDREARLSSLDAIRDDVLLVSAMHANNELGSLNDVSTISAACRRVGALLHVDAVQSFLKPEATPTLTLPRGAGEVTTDEPLHPRPVPVRLVESCDFVSLSAHKVNGPKGAGALYVRAGVKLKPLIAGGGQEREVRGGTENVAAIAGFAAAVREHVASPAGVSAAVREAFLTSLEGLGAVRSVRTGPCLHGHAHVRFPGVSAETLLIALDRLGVAASSGAACSSGAVEASHVLLACGYSVAEAKEGIRFTLGAETTPAELAEAVSRIARALQFCLARTRSN